MKLTITSPSFCKHPVLISEIKTLFPNFKFKLNTDGLKLSGQDLICFLQEADIWLVGTEKVDEAVLTACPQIKIIAKYGVGLDNIDFEACEKLGVKVLYTQGVNAQSVAELALGNILMLLHNSYVTSNLLKQGVWHKSGGYQLYGKTVGIIGVGHVGKKLINLLKPFDCKILVNDIVDQSEYYQSVGAQYAELSTLLAESDIVSLHVPLTDQTKYLITRQELNLMKRSAYLINTSRGSVVNQQDLAWALKNNFIAGGAMDVYEQEPCEDLCLLTIPNLITTPHIGGNAEEAVLAMGRGAMRVLYENLVGRSFKG